MSDNGGYLREIPFSPHGWELRYFTWILGLQGHPSFAKGSVILTTEIVTDLSQPFLRMVWMEPVT